MRLLITAAIIVHCLATVMVSMPDPPNGVKEAQGLFLFWVRPLYLWQNWSLFSPDTPQYNTRMEAEVEFRDGKKFSHRFAHDEVNGVFERFLVENWRKLLVDNGYKYEWLHPYVARYVARHYAADGAPVSKVRIVRWWAKTPAPEPPLGPSRVIPPYTGYKILYVEEIKP